MSFWNTIETIYFCPKASLQACHNSHYPNICDVFLNPKSKKKILSRRAFCFTPSYHFSGSMCVEAAFSFSFFLIFMANVFSLILLFVFYADDLGKLQQQGKQAAVYAYTAEGFMNENEDLIVLRKTRTIGSPFPLLSMPDCKLISQCLIKPWTGYNVESEGYREKEEELVYMTEYGEVYHKSRNCTHLSLSIYVTAYGNVDEERNQSGGAYYPCEICGDHSFATVAFLTTYGNRYHSTINCRGLKRTIRCIALSETGNVPACKKCG